MRITRSFPGSGDAVKKEAALPDIDYLQGSNLLIRSVSILRAGPNVVVWATVDVPGGQPQRVYLFTYSPSRVDIPLDQLEGKTVGYARGLFYSAMNEAFAYPEKGAVPVGAVLPRMFNPEKEGSPAPAVARPEIPELPSPTPSLPRAQASATLCLYGGRADEEGVSEEDVDPEELRMGIEVEHEHTSDDKTAKRIALDHLAETKDLPIGYYTGLDMLEKFLDSLRHMNTEKVKEKIQEVKRSMGL